MSSWEWLVRKKNSDNRKVRRRDGSVNRENRKHTIYTRLPTRARVSYTTLSHPNQSLAPCYRSVAHSKFMQKQTFVRVGNVHTQNVLTPSLDWYWVKLEQLGAIRFTRYSVSNHMICLFTHIISFSISCLQGCLTFFCFDETNACSIWYALKAVKQVMSSEEREIGN